MRLLLDTHPLIWWLTNDDHLSASAAACRHPCRFRSPISSDERFTALPVTAEHAEAAGRLPGPHRDPWDRIMMAQALAEQCHIVTVDKVFSDYNVQVLW